MRGPARTITQHIEPPTRQPPNNTEAGAATLVLDRVCARATYWFALAVEGGVVLLQQPTLNDLQDKSTHTRRSDRQTIEPHQHAQAKMLERASALHGGVWGQRSRGTATCQFLGGEAPEEGEVAGAEVLVLRAVVLVQGRLHKEEINHNEGLVVNAQLSLTIVSVSFGRPAEGTAGGGGCAT